jgi:tetratricopeptide (TPR) repeat protein
VPSSETVGQRLKRLRLDRGLSQRDLSSPGVSYAYISRIEAGARTPSVKALRMLARKLKVSVEYLETGRDIREDEDRELRLTDAELELRLGTDYAEAEKKIREVLDEAVRSGDPITATRAQLALGVAAAARGSHLEAAETLDAALKESPVSPRERSDVFAALGRAYSALGAADRAVAVFEKCLEELGREAPDDHANHVRFAAYLSYALTDAGEHERAASVIRNALHHADDDPDPFTQVRLQWALARSAGIDGRTRESLDHIRHAIALLAATEDNLRLARAYILAAGVEVTEGEISSAKEHVRLAKRLLGTGALASDRGMIHIVRARIAVAEGRGADGVSDARHAVDLLGTTYGGEQGEAIWALAQAFALEGNEELSVDGYRRAIDLLVVHGRRYEAARASHELGTFLQERGRDAEAEPVFQRAADLGYLSEAQASGKS